jgi:hypothetical protein
MLREEWDGVKCHPRMSTTNELPRHKRTGYQKAQTQKAFAAERRDIGPARNKRMATLLFGYL